LSSIIQPCRIQTLQTLLNQSSDNVGSRHSFKSIFLSEFGISLGFKVPAPPSPLISFNVSPVYRSVYLFCYPGCPALAWLSFSGYPSWLSYPCCPVLAVLSRLSCPGCPVLAVLSWLFCLGCCVLAVLFCLFCSGRPVWLSFFGCP
jgi:hypothetical protein